MKIGILTYHCVTNFGAQLQTLSTIGYMKKHGHEPIVLNWFPQDLEDFYRRECPKEQYEEQFNFAQQSMPVSNLCRTLDDLNAEIDRLQLDAIFIGSDALFDYKPIESRYSFSLRKFKRIPPNSKVASNHDLPNPFWGCFADYIKNEIPFCGFSISSQNMPYYKLNVAEKNEMNRLLNRFTRITVRDNWTKKMVEYVSGRNDVKITPDPVFAFNNNTDFLIAKEDLLAKYNLPNNYILISFCKDILTDDFVNEVIREIESKTDSFCVSFPMPRKLKKYSTLNYIDLPLPTLDWYYLIKYSQGYIGELMHPIIVCLHNSIPFFCFDQYGTYKTIIPRLWSKFIPESSKIYDILEKADFKNQMCPYLYANKMTPAEVVHRFYNFDKLKCERFAESQYLRYIDGMDIVLSSLE